MVQGTSSPSDCLAGEAASDTLQVFSPSKVCSIISQCTNPQDVRPYLLITEDIHILELHIVGCVMLQTHFCLRVLDTCVECVTLNAHFYLRVIDIVSLYAHPFETHLPIRVIACRHQMVVVDCKFLIAQRQLFILYHVSSNACG
jgi:hypothetical protein